MLADFPQQRYLAGWVKPRGTPFSEPVSSEDSRSRIDITPSHGYSLLKELSTFQYSILESHVSAQHDTRRAERKRLPLRWKQSRTITFLLPVEWESLPFSIFSHQNEAESKKWEKSLVWELGIRAEISGH